ncbi:glycosyltransferase [bacterium]
MEQEIFERNMEALGKGSPASRSAVEAVHSDPPDIRLVESRRGDYTAVMETDSGRQVHIHSSVDPRAESEKFVSSLQPKFGKWIVWLGPGLWYGVRALKRRMFHCPVCVIEADPAILRAVMKIIPIDDILDTPGMRVLTGSAEKISLELERRPVRIETPRNLVAFPKAVETRQKEYDEILNTLNGMPLGSAPGEDPANIVAKKSFGSVEPGDTRVLVTADDRYSDAVAATIAPAGATVRNIFDLGSVENILDYRPTFIFSFSANLMKWPDTFKLISGLKSKLNIPLVVWNMEDPMYFFDPAQKDRLLETARAANLFFTQSAQYIHMYEEAGVEAKYLPTGARPDMFKKNVPPHGSMDLDFSFFGFLTPDRISFFKELYAKLGGMKFRLVGPGLATEDFIDMIRRTKVNLTALTNCDVTEDEHWALSDRAWEIPYAGGFLLQDRRRHLGDHFSEGEIAVFGDVDECAEKISYYAARADERNKILTSARTRISAEHLWARRMETILGHVSGLV